MGLLDRLRPKEERMNMETGKFEPVDKVTLRNEQTGEGVRVSREEKPLTREEQVPAPRQQPWKTERGKRVIKSIGSGVKRVDRAVVNHNRRQPSRPATRYSTQSNYNPFGSMFDTGMNYNPPRKKSSGSKTKYKVIGGKAYPIAGTGKKHKKKSGKGKRRSNNNWDTFGAFGGYKF